MQYCGICGKPTKRYNMVLISGERVVPCDSCYEKRPKGRRDPHITRHGLVR